MVISSVGRHGKFILKIGDFSVVEFYSIVCLAIVAGFAIVLLLTAWLSADKERGIIKQIWDTYFGGDNDREYPPELRKPPDKD